jgi:alkanesulfonate monooxygenase SsuD/methylene tetrahydromethanopterin reductase-like flavin-dependent oxidoreductase (luciferase family)
MTILPCEWYSNALSFGAMTMRLGVTMPRTASDGSPLTGSAFTDGARLVERVGFDSLWAFDAIGRGFILPDPLIAVSVAAAVTQRLTVGTCILQVPLRRPVELAHRILTAHLACQGRLLLGVGAGSTKTDFDAIGLDFTTRMQQLDDALAVMRRLWQGEQVGAANLTPWPSVIGGPKLLIGSWSGKQWIPRAAKDFDGWIASAAKTSYATLADGIRRYRDAGGTRAIVTNIATDLAAPTDALADDVPFHLRCGRDAAADRLGRLADLGFDEAIVVPRGHGEASLAALRALLR